MVSVLSDGQEIKVKNWSSKIDEECDTQMSYDEIWTGEDEEAIKQIWMNYHSQRSEASLVR